MAIHSPVKVLTLADTHADARVGDIDPCDGNEIVAIERKPAQHGRYVIKLTTRSYERSCRPNHATNGCVLGSGCYSREICEKDDEGARPYDTTYGANWESETFAVSLHRAEFMHSLADHS